MKRRKIIVVKLHDPILSFNAYCSGGFEINRNSKAAVIRVNKEQREDEDCLNTVPQAASLTSAIASD